MIATLCCPSVSVHPSVRLSTDKNVVPLCDSHNVLALMTAQRVVATKEAAAILAVTAGLDQDLNSMAPEDGGYACLIAQKQTPVLQAAIDRAAGNVLRLKFAAVRTVLCSCHSEYRLSHHPLLRVVHVVVCSGTYKNVRPSPSDRGCSTHP